MKAFLTWGERQSSYINQSIAIANSIVIINYINKSNMGLGQFDPINPMITFTIIALRGFNSCFEMQKNESM